MVDFSRVISVRERRTDKAKAREAAAFAACEAARGKLMAARDEMEAFVESIKGLETRLLSELLESRITVHDVNRIRDKLREASEYARKLVANVKQAQAELNEREHNLESEREASREIQSKLRRITELDKQLTEIEAKQLVVKEDATMDEFADTMNRRGLPHA